MENERSLEKLDEAGVDWKEIYKQLDQVFDERIKQNKKWGIQNHTPMHWIPILGEEFGEVCEAALENHFDNKEIANYEKEIVQVIAVCFAMLESLHNTKRIPNNYPI